MHLLKIYLYLIDLYIFMEYGEVSLLRLQGKFQT